MTEFFHKFHVKCTVGSWHPAIFLGSFHFRWAGATLWDICSKGPIRSKLRGYSIRLCAICGWLSCSIWWLNLCSLLFSYWICHEEQQIQKSFLCRKDIQITLIFPSIYHGSMFLQGKGQSFVSRAYSKRAQVVQNDLAENEKEEEQMKQTIAESWQSVEMMKTSSTCPSPHPPVRCVIQGSSHSGFFSPVPVTHFGEISKVSPFPCFSVGRSPLLMQRQQIWMCDCI